MARAIGIGVAVAVVMTLLLAFDVPDALELPVRDFAMRRLPREPATTAVIVAIDERSLREIGQWPWPRARLAELIDRAADAGARGVVLDILLTAPRDGDAELARAMHRLPVAVVAVLSEDQEWLVPTEAIASGAIVAHGNFELDRDGILRRFATTKQSRTRAYTALPLEAASMRTTIAVPVGQTIAPAFRTRPSSIPIVSAAELLTRGANLRGKIVFVGPTELGFGDRVLTPVSRRLVSDPGVTVHAAATESLLRGEQIRELPPIFGGLVAGSIAAVILATSSRIVAATIAALVLIGGVIALAINGIAIPIITLLVVVAGSIAGVETTRVRITASRLEEIATKLAERRAQEVESQRMLAHELKTPLASMRSLTQLLGGFDLTEGERRRVASLLEAEAGKLQSMVHALLDLERLPLRDFAASSSVFDLGMLARTRIDFLQASTDRTLTTSIADDVFVRGDAALLERVIDNLVGNALKYTQSPV
ncbi:MAG TPA: CHASE2 domain-containing protein, partial [Thermoanaerobaculia bacterium]|nr:CHASE2 domain-containing protein [Thermoanaerobaculia bacterium]